MESFKRWRLTDRAQRMKFSLNWPTVCAFAVLLGSCGQLSLGSYDAIGGAAGAGNPSVGAGGRQNGGGSGTTSGGAGQAQSTAGAEQTGGLPARGGANNGAVGGGSGGVSASGGGGRAGASSKAGQSGGGGQAGGGGVPTARPSCKALPATCGPRGSENCCPSLPVQGGPFVLGGASTESAKAYVSDFSLDKYEVTVARFRKFLAHYDEWRADHNPAPGAGANPRVGGSGWQSAWDGELAQSASELEARIRDCNQMPFSTLRVAERTGELTLAMNCLNWYEAAAFCAWDDARLPTELEWEYAATGGDRASTYPWPTMDLSQAYANYGCYFSLTPDQYDPAWPPCGFRVGSGPLGVGRWGHMDLAGSMAEWVFDGPSVYPSLCNDCANSGAGLQRGLRGGSWAEPPEWLSGRARRFTDAERRMFFEGVRCASSKGATCASSCDPNADCNDAGGEVSCSCREGFIGDGHTCARASSCAQLHRARPDLASGRYVLSANDSQFPSEFLTDCEMSVDGGGWTLVMNQDETFDPMSFGDESCAFGRCTSLAYSRVPLESDLLLDFNGGPIVEEQFSLRALIRGVQPAALGKSVRELFTTGPFFIDREDNSNVSVSVPSQAACVESLPSDLGTLLCKTCAAGQPSCTTPVLVFGDPDPGCGMEPFRFAIGGAYSYSEAWDNCAGWPQKPDYGGGNYYPKNVRIWVR
jgi:formylglycine-generating enzyme required for sulfatase activity